MLVKNSQSLHGETREGFYYVREVLDAKETETPVQLSWLPGADGREILRSAPKGNGCEIQNKSLCEPVRVNDKTRTSASIW